MTNLIRWSLNRFFHSWLGHKAVLAMIKCTQYRVFRPFTVRAMELDALRLRARTSHPGHKMLPTSSKLHFGCGDRQIPGWVNVDVFGTDPLVDLGSGALPWQDQVFDAVVSHQVIEHLELRSELIPLLREVRRVCKPGAEIWLSCPDMEIICRHYLEDRAARLVEDRLRTATVETGLTDVPPQHFVNCLFVQCGEHQNLFDLELLDWTMRKAGFAGCERVTPDDFARRFPEFPPHYADAISIYVRAFAPALGEVQKATQAGFAANLNNGQQHDGDRVTPTSPLALCREIIADRTCVCCH